MGVLNGLRYEHFQYSGVRVHVYQHSLKAVNDMVNDKNALSVNHTQLNLAESKSHSGIRAECILHMAVSIGVID